MQTKCADKRVNLSGYASTQCKTCKKYSYGPLCLAESEVMEKPTIPVLVTLRANYSAGAITPAVRELQVGCIRSTQPSKKVL